MSTTVTANAEDNATQQPPVRRRRSNRDVGGEATVALDNTTGPNNLSGVDGVARPTKATGTRKRGRGRLPKDGYDSLEEEIIESTNESVWLDGPLALTLLPPLGSFLTGGDFIRDGLILALLFYYLRVLVKTPWELYLKSRARRPPPDLEIPDDDDAEPEYIAKIRATARSELRLAELVYLGLCLLTPFLGIILLRYGAGLLSADGSIAWFSSGLFVLTTGVKPWRHLIQLLLTRTDSLHDIVHHPHVYSRAQKQSLKERDDIAAILEEQSEEFREAFAKLKARLDGFESALEEVRLTADTHQNQSVSLSSHLEKTVAAWPGQVDELKLTTTRIETNLDDLNTTIRNTSRAHEVLRLESDERTLQYQKSIEALVEEVEQLHKRVATAATTAAAAHASAGAAQTAILDASKRGMVINVPNIDTGNGSAHARGNGQNTSSREHHYPLTPSHSAGNLGGAGNGFGQSLAWTPPKGEGIDPWAGVTDPVLTAALDRIHGATSSSFGPGPGGLHGRTRSGSAARRTRSASRSHGLGGSPASNGAFTFPFPSPLVKLMAWLDFAPVPPNASFVQIIIHNLVQLLLLPVKASQWFLQWVWKVLGFTPEPRHSSPRMGVVAGNVSAMKKTS